jgi:hypothetical protein
MRCKNISSVLASKSLLDFESLTQNDYFLIKLDNSCKVQTAGFEHNYYLMIVNYYFSS